MTRSNLTFEIHDIRDAIKHAHRDVLINNTVNVAPIHTMIEGLTQNMKRNTDAIDGDARGKIASELSVLAGELEELEKLIEQRMKEEND